MNFAKILDFTISVCYTAIVNMCRCSSVVEHQPSKLVARVRFPSPAPYGLPQLSWIEQCPSKAEVEGSNPSGSTKTYGGLSSVGRTPDCGSGGQGFDPLRSPHKNIPDSGVSPSGKALDSDSNIAQVRILPPQP